MPRTRDALLAEAAYRTAVEEIRAEIAEILRRAALDLDETQLTRSISEFVPAAARLVASGQAAAQTAASRFLAEFLGAETRSTPRPLAIGNEIAGQNSEGAPLLPLIAAGIGRTIFGAIIGGQSARHGVEAGARSVANFASSEIVAAADSELVRQAERRRGVRGWIWVPVGLTCAACLSYGSGTVRPFSERPPRHSRCNCIVSIQMEDDPQTVTRPTGEQLFRSMTPEQQAASFRTAGAEKAELVRSGRVSLADLMAVEQHANWRDTLVERPLAAVVDG